MRRALVLVSLLLLAPAGASGKTLAPGALRLGGQLGGGIKMGPLLGGAPGYFVLGGETEYMFDQAWSFVGDLSLGLASTLPLRLHLGTRYRLTEIDSPVAPFVQLQLSAAEVFGVLGANLSYVGGRLAMGADYFLTGELGVGALVGLDLGSTLGERPALYGVVDLLVFASYGF